MSAEPDISPTSEPLTNLGTLGARLAAVRRARGLTRRQVAAAAGVSASFLGMVERGETDMSLTRFTRLADFLGASIADLLSDDPAPAPPDVRAIASAQRIDRGEGVDYRIIRHDHPQLVAVTLAPGARFATSEPTAARTSGSPPPAPRRSSTARSATRSAPVTRSAFRASWSTDSPTTPTSRRR